MRSALPALRVSNAIAVTMLFLTGYAYGRMTRHRPVLVGSTASRTRRARSRWTRVS